MSDDHGHPAKESQKTPPAEPDVTELEPAGEVTVEHYPVPPKGAREPKIHPRRPLPPVPESPKKSEDTD